MQEINVLSPYKAADLVTEWLADTEFGGQKISPQMMYQYVKAERIPSRRGVDGHIQIDEEDLKKWFEGYVERKRTLAAKATDSNENRRTA